MPPKKSKNGFYRFMQDFKKTQEQKGKIYPEGIKDVQNDPECSKAWQQLSEKEKQRYNGTNDKGKGQTEKLTGWGERISDILVRQKKHQEYEANMRADIEETLRLAQVCESVPDLTVYIIHVNYFYSKDLPDSSVLYIPAEIAICEFSIAEGIKRSYHQIIKSDVELGYARSTLEHCDRTHKLCPDYEYGEDDYSKIYKKFREFLKTTEEQTGKIPPIYTRQKFVTVVSCFLDRITLSAGLPKETFPLYSLECLFGKLMFMCNPDKIDRHSCNPVLLAESEFDKDSFAYSPNIECLYHHQIEGTSIHCSLAIIRQWCFIICAYCCNWFNIDIIPDVHCPALHCTDDIDFISTSVKSLNIDKKFQPSTLKSMTGVSDKYRYEKAGRTFEEEAQRRKEAMKNPLEIIDHGNNAPGEIAKTFPKFYRPLRPPNNLSVIFKGSDNPSTSHSSTTSSLGATGHGKSSATVKRPQMKGIGRGGIATD
ncbi:protein maelstrom homolog [Fopius arisanus]|uniref:Protein maelstrom homolog n=2 Tax=Fopius arisanus TaxID=64838 RepID=A0A9R1SU61_9HYME|nr:PREDICTED: protein maelstrom homolog [Fopius arisanus]